MRFLRSKKLIALVAAVLVAAAAAAVGVSAVIGRTVVADGENLHYQVVRTVADGFDSGWHIHPGLAIVQVQEGSLQITQGGCTPKTVGPGETLIEVPYTPVRGVATGRVAWDGDVPRSVRGTNHHSRAQSLSVDRQRPKPNWCPA